MGMQSASVQQSPNQGGGKGMGQQSALGQQQVIPQQFDTSMNAPAGGQNGQPDPSMMAPAVMPSRQQPMGKGGRNVTMPGQGAQPRMGQPNAYSNTIQPWDNASIQPQKQSGKGKGY
jgi:hypothetical protein